MKARCSQVALGLVLTMALAFIGKLSLGKLQVFTIYKNAWGPCNEDCLGPRDIIVDREQLMNGPVTFEQDDPRLIQIIRENHLHPPSTEAYQLKSPNNDDPSMGQSQEIRKIIGDQENGFFVECGALDGETRSNSLVFEKRFGWTGVLVEADPSNFELLKTKNRKAWAVDACLSTLPYPNKVIFHQQFNIGKIASSMADPKMPNMAEVQCLPLYSILVALNVTTVHYFSLDVEGFELEVLRTIPWEKVDIQTLSVEFVHGKEGKEAIKEYMATKGYGVFSEVINVNMLANDFIFVKREMLASIQT